MSDIDNQIKLAEEETKQAGVKFEGARIKLKNLQRQRDRQQAALAVKESGIEIYHSGDYAGLTCGVYRFYFGYEHTICPKHGNDTRCGCDDEEWAFVARDTDKVELMRLPQSRLASKHGDMVDYLLHGIGQFLDSLPKPAKKRRRWYHDCTGGGYDNFGNPQ